MYATTFQEQREVVEGECSGSMDLSIVFRLVDQWRDQEESHERWQAECYFSFSECDDSIRHEPVGAIAILNHTQRDVWAVGDSKCRTRVRHIFTSPEDFESNTEYADMLAGFVKAIANRWPGVEFENAADPLTVAIDSVCEAVAAVD